MFWDFRPVSPLGWPLPLYPPSLALLLWPKAALAKLLSAKAGSIRTERPCPLPLAPPSITSPPLARPLHQHFPLLICHHQLQCGHGGRRNLAGNGRRRPIRRNGPNLPPCRLAQLCRSRQFLFWRRHSERIEPLLLLGLLIATNVGRRNVIFTGPIGQVP